MDLYSKGALSSFCVDISDSTLRQIYKIENQSYCNLHRRIFRTHPAMRW